MFSDKTEIVSEIMDGKEMTSSSGHLKASQTHLAQKQIHEQTWLFLRIPFLSEGMVCIPGT